MARRYFSGPRGAFIGYDDDLGVSMTADTVFEAEQRVINTGLLDARGQPILRTDERGPLGFCREKIDA